MSVVDRCNAIFTSSSDEAWKNFRVGAAYGCNAGSKIGSIVLPIIFEVHDSYITNSFIVPNGSDLALVAATGVLAGGCVGGTVVGICDCAAGAMTGAYHGLTKDISPKPPAKMD